jgi:hypothetical protein
MRRILSSIVCAALAMGVAIAQETGQKAESRTPGMTNDVATVFATNRCFSKGGLGIVNKGLYIVVKSTRNDRNEVILKPTEETEQRWTGRSVAKAEIVILSGGKIRSVENLPDQFDLSKAAIVSFESDKIRFFDFQTMSGGYYERIKSEQ